MAEDKTPTREDEMRDGFQDGLEPLEPLDCLTPGEPINTDVA